jgi:hypothetical protein
MLTGTKKSMLAGTKISPAPAAARRAAPRTAGTKISMLAGTKISMLAGTKISPAPAAARRVAPRTAPLSPPCTAGTHRANLQSAEPSLLACGTEISEIS